MTAPVTHSPLVKSAFARASVAGRICAAMGAIVALPALVLPQRQLINSHARRGGAFVFGLGTSFPVLMLTILSFKRWPAFPVAQGSSETSQ